MSWSITKKKSSFLENIRAVTSSNTKDEVNIEVAVFPQLC